MDPIASQVVLPTPEAHMIAPTPLIEPPKLPANHLNHPPYAEMIVSAIKTLNEKKGSSRKAIAKYIDSVYTNLPQSHSALLTHHLKRLKKNGIVLMLKHSYKLPKSAAVSGGAPSAVTEKRGRGRPPKSNKTTVVTTTLPIPTSGSPIGKRGRGRPSKVIKPKPIKAVGVGLVKRGRGRPPKISKPNITTGPSDVVVAPVSNSGEKKGRGRPKKNIQFPTVISVLGVVSGEVVVPLPLPPVISKPRGRPRKIGGGGPPKPKRVSTGRPVGRPKKGAGPAPHSVSVPAPVPIAE